MWLEAVSNWHPELVTISSPCVPWSTGGLERGLFTADGMLLPEALSICKFLQPRIVMLEQVAGIGSHAHLKIIVKTAHWAGYVVKFARIADVQAISPVKRSRWLAILTRAEDPMVHSLPMIFWDIVESLTPENIDAIGGFPFDQYEQLQIDSQTKRLAMMPSLVPGSNKNLSPREAFASRLDSTKNTVKPFVASYGAQHELNPSHLEKKGFFCHFLALEGREPRFWHPIEISMLHGFTGQLILSNNLKDSWRQIGNFICMGHAILIISNAMNWIPERAPPLDVKQVFQVFQQQRVRSNDLHPQRFSRCTVYGHDTGNCPDFDSLINGFLEQLNGTLMPFGQYWDFDGWHSIQMLLHEDTPASAISIPDTPGDNEEDAAFPPTVPFAPVLQGSCAHGQTHFYFWFAADLPIDDLVRYLGSQYHVVSNDLREDGSSLTLLHDPTLPVDRSTPANAFSLMMDGKMTIFPLNEVSWNMVSDGGNKRVYDKMGEVKDKAANMSVVFHTDVSALPQVSQSNTLSLAAIQSSQHWHAHDAENKRLNFYFQAADPVTCTIQTFFDEFLPEDTLHELGYMKFFSRHDQVLVLTLQPKNDLHPAPYHALRAFITTRFFRIMMDTLWDGSGQCIRIKWDRNLWRGYVSERLTLDVLVNLIQQALGLFQPASMRILHKGKQIFDLENTRVGDHVDGSICLVYHFVLSMHGGGGGPAPTTTKGGYQIQVKNSIASSLLTEGYDLKWITAVLDKAMKGSSKQCAAVAAMPAGPDRLQSILQLVQETGEEIPVIKSKASSAATYQAKVKKKQMNHPLPENYTVLDGYFVNEDGSPAKQLGSIESNASGFILMSQEQSLAWLRAGDQVSTDELGLVIFGEASSETRLNTSRLTVPCIDEHGRSVLVACTLAQLGQRKLQVCKMHDHKVDEIKSVLVAITANKEDWTNEWSRIVQNPGGFFKAHLGQELKSIWGRSFRAGRTPTSPATATSVQMHGIIDEDQAASFFGKTGIQCPIWVTPKTNTGQLHPDWKLIWVDPKSSADITILVAKLPNAAGQTKIKGRWAIRVHRSHFAESWRIINPSVEVPDDINTSLTFKVENVPFGTSKDMITKWGSHIGWKFRALRPIGPKAWFVGTDRAPPQSSPLAFNGNPVIIREVKPSPSHGSSPIIAGPQPSRSVKASPPASDSSMLSGDPWANFVGTQGNSGIKDAHRATPGPIEQRFAGQETRLQQLEQKIEGLQQSQQAQQEDFQKFAHEVQSSERSNRQYLETTLQSFRSEINNSFNQAVQQQGRHFDSSMQELKALLISTTKRKTPGEGDEDMS
eukprot:Skav234628  [mRNA]  locus=scaffold171:195924:199841:+ [translate_table: standard]